MSEFLKDEKFVKLFLSISSEKIRGLSNSSPIDDTHGKNLVAPNGYRRKVVSFLPHVAGGKSNEEKQVTKKKDGL